MTPLLVVLALLQAPLDEGTLIVEADSSEVAREALRLTTTRHPSGVGWTLASTVRYDRSRPVVVLAPILELAPDLAPATLEYTVADPREPSRILGQLVRGRFGVRLLGRRRERAREFLAPAPTVILDDSVFALYLAAAWWAQPKPVSVTAIFPRAGRREVLVVQDLGVMPTTLNHASVSLRHVILTGGANGLVDVWLDADGRLSKVDIPSRHLTAERAP